MIKKEIHIYLALIVPLSYFFLLWGIPWGEFTLFGLRLPYSYLFDVAFGISVLIAYQTKDLFWNNFKPSGFLIRAIIILFISWLCNIAIDKLEFINSPFPFLNNKAVKLLVIAPLFEELIFRGAIFEAFRHLPLSPKRQIFLNALLFSVSHAFALTILDDVFHGFIYFQLCYTFVLGWICCKARIQSQGLMAPIILHMLFNLVFYFYLN